MGGEKQVLEQRKMFTIFNKTTPGMCKESPNEPTKKENNNKESVERRAKNRYVQTVHIRANQTSLDTGKGRAHWLSEITEVPFFCPSGLAK